jgi:hypothetical protein
VLDIAAKANTPEHPCQNRQAQGKPVMTGMQGGSMDDFSWSLVILVATGALAWAGAMLGVRLRQWRRLRSEGERTDYTTVMASTLTLLGLVAGFAFSMATNRYEAAIETEHREAAAIHLAQRSAGLLPAGDAATVQALIARYADARWREFVDGPGTEAAASGELGSRIWSAVETAAAGAPTPVTAVALNAVNAMLAARAETVAAFSDRMPLPAWALMIFLAVVANAILGYAAHRADETLFVALPVSLAASFFLIAEMQSPGAGIIQVEARNLAGAAQALNAD